MDKKTIDEFNLTAKDLKDGLPNPDKFVNRIRKNKMNMLTYCDYDEKVKHYEKMVEHKDKTYNVIM